jgi:hypothetical protein
MKSLQIAVIAAAFLLLTVPNRHPSAAQEPVPTAKIVLKAPSTARVGELVRLDASESTADSYKWVLVPESVDFEVYAEGRKAVFSARDKGVFQFVVAVAKNGTVDVIVHTIRILGPPDEPSDVRDVEGHIALWLWNAPVSDDEKVALADAFDKVAEMGLGEAPAWIYETKRAVDEALGDAKPRWDAFLKKVGGYMQQLGEAGVMLEPDEHAQIWKEIALALRRN